MLQQSVRLSGLSEFGTAWSQRMGNPWLIRKITDSVLFSTLPGPWILVERNHYQRWINLSADPNFMIKWAGWRKQ